MTYARSRLWLGMTAVGSLVVICFVASLMGLPSRWLPNGSEFSTADFAALGLLLGMYAAFMLGFDLLGGYIIPRRHDRWSGSLGSYLRSWMLGIAIQS